MLNGRSNGKSIGKPDWSASFAVRVVIAPIASEGAAIRTSANASNTLER
jgi:hypothetical protein